MEIKIYIISQITCILLWVYLLIEMLLFMRKSPKSEKIQDKPAEDSEVSIKN